tara:strand:+ start:516 stop:995 length:480 start_codon:yes stop_codon:yes gene_type:complete
MGYCFAKFEQQEKDLKDNVKDTDIETFKDKYKDIVELFEGEFLKKDSDGNIWILGQEDFSIYSRDFPRIDDGKPNKKRARARFFSNIADSEGDCDFGWGTKGFSDEFYADLYNLLDECSFYVSEANCGDNGYYSGTFYLLEKGILESFQYYQNVVDEDW